MARELTQKEQLFVDQMTRKRIVDWCDASIRSDGARQPIMLAQALPETNPPTPDAYLAHAIAKAWVSKDGTKILSAGWETAARFLKR